MNLRKIVLIILAFALVVVGIVGYNFYSKIYKSNVLNDSEVYIASDANFEDVIEAVSPAINNEDNFIWVAKKKNYPNKIKAGRYILKQGMNNNSLVDLLRSGKQTPITISFNNQDSLDKLAGRIAEQIEADSVALLEAFTDASFLKENNFDKATVLGMCIPNSYEFYWNTSAEKFRDKMLNEYKSFWNQERLTKAKKLNLSKKQVSTLASIVQKETAHTSERPIVAGLYLNRFKNNWALQADPTVIFVLKQKHGQDYVVKRVLNDDLKIESPYNTYLNVGIPPSLIAMPDISSIDAVLNPANHDYYYMCASVSNIGYHEFANSLAQHNRNAQKYQQWITKQGINR